MLKPEVVEYRANETKRLVTDPDLKVHCGPHFHSCLGQKKAGVTENTIKRVRRGGTVPRAYSRLVSLSA